jgi:S1-C subfamily serine protease
VRPKVYILASAAIFLLAPSVARGQRADSVIVRTFTYPDAQGRGPGTGFMIAMSPGPGNSYNYSYVHSIVSGSAAEAAGLMVGDTIVSIDGRDMLHGELFPVRVQGTRYRMLVRRGSEEIELVYIYPETAQAAPRESPAAASPP